MDMVGTTEAARRLGVSTVTLRVLVKTGQLKAIRVNNRNFKISVVELDAYAKRNAVESEATP